MQKLILENKTVSLNKVKLYVDFSFIFLTYKKKDSVTFNKLI